MIAKKAALELEDPLAYLPHKDEAEYQPHQVIYNEEQPSSGLSLIVNGRVKVTTTADDGSLIVTGIFGSEEFIGESALLGLPQPAQATALEKTTLMTWAATEIEAYIERQPKLGVALIQLLAERCLDCEQRLESLALNKTSERVALTLLRFAKSGTRESDGAVRIAPLTHQLLSEYIGTSREIVTSRMNHLRQKGLVRYSRKAMQIYSEALTEHLRNQH